MVSNGISGSPLYYIITYMDYNAGIICDSQNLSCWHGVPCASFLPAYCLPLSGPVSISLSATNRLGDGSTSTIILSKSKFVDKF